MIGRSRYVALLGITGHVIDVEAHISPGLPSFAIVGQTDTSIQEARDRARSAVVSSGIPWLQQRITVSLSPASLPKRGSAADVAIAVAILAAAGVVDGESAMRQVLVGELGLDGRLRPVRGVLPAVMAAAGLGAEVVGVLWANAQEASLVSGVTVCAYTCLSEVLAAMGCEAARQNTLPAVVDVVPYVAGHESGDMADVRGQAPAANRPSPGQD